MMTIAALCMAGMGWAHQAPQQVSTDARSSKIVLGAGVMNANSSYFVVTEHGVVADGKTDVTAVLQKIIDDNPNRTIYFPDGTYLLSSSLTTPADPQKSVSLVLANYAILKAASSWPGGAVVRLGATSPKNDINTIGSNYGLYGGIIDGSGKADGVSIDGGRETKIVGVSIKHVQTGVHIKYGANSGSSDADVRDVNIVGNNSSNSIGVLLEGYDNSLRNMRIASVNKGVVVKSGGNSLSNIHPLYIFGSAQDYASSCGFDITGGYNWLYFCYSDQMATGFLLRNGAQASMTDCFAMWYSTNGGAETAIKSEGKLQSVVTGFHVGFQANCTKRTLLQVGEAGGSGALYYPFPWSGTLSSDDVSKDYIK